MNHYSRRQVIPRRVAVPAFAVILLLISGAGSAFATDTPTPSASPVASGTTVVLSPLAIAVNNAYAALADARAKVSVAEKASKASPTDATLKANLLNARANAATAQAALKAAQDAYVANAKTTITTLKAAMDTAQSNLQNARQALDKLRKSLEPALKTAREAAIAKAKADTGIGKKDFVAIAQAKDLVGTTYTALSTARLNVSTAEKASHASPTDAALLTALNDARVKAAAALVTFNSARDALTLVMGSNKDQSKTPIDTKSIEQATLAAFNLAHPELVAAQKAVSDAESAFKIARKAFQDAQQVTKDMGKKAITPSTSNHISTSDNTSTNDHTPTPTATPTHI